MRFFRIVILGIIMIPTLMAQPFSHTYLITSDRKPTPPLINLLSVCGIVHDGSIESIIAATQKDQPIGFLRAKGKERWQLTSYYANSENAIIQQCRQLSMIEEIKPSTFCYEYAIVHGGTINGMRSRIAFLTNLWKEGYRWHNLVILTGQRPLDPIIESQTTLIDKNNGYLVFKTEWHLTISPTNETDMVRMILEQSVLPAAWKNIPITIVDTPLQKKETEICRPTTIDTMHQWLSTDPVPGSILAISHQPFIGYQDAVVRSILPKEFILETVGPQAESPIESAVLVDTVARWLYNAQHLS